MSDPLDAVSESVFPVARAVALTDDQLGRDVRLVEPSKQAETLLAELEKAKTKELWRLLVSLNIRHVGPVAARAISMSVSMMSPRGRPRSGRRVAAL